MLIIDAEAAVIYWPSTIIIPYEQGGCDCNLDGGPKGASEDWVRRGYGEGG